MTIFLRCYNLILNQKCLLMTISICVHIVRVSKMQLKDSQYPSYPITYKSFSIDLNLIMLRWEERSLMIKSILPSSLIWMTISMVMMESRVNNLKIKMNNILITIIINIIKIILSPIIQILSLNNLLTSNLKVIKANLQLNQAK
jgi:hypothetical protein